MNRDRQRPLSFARDLKSLRRPPPGAAAATVGVAMTHVFVGRVSKIRTG